MEKLPKEPEKKQSYNDFVKYSGLAFQMIGIILLFTWGGIKLDKYFETEFPVFTVVFVILSIFVAIYQAVRNFLRK